MHEVGLARAVAGALRERGLSPRDIRLLVRGGQSAPDAFDASLRAHLAAEMPGVDDEVEIVHLATPRLCASCGRGFEAVDGARPCPQCGGTGLPTRQQPETIEIELR